MTEASTPSHRYSTVFRPGLFVGQTIIVTGGGSGIGRCTAHELAALGAHVVLLGRTLEKLERTAAEIREDTAALGEHAGGVSFHGLDIRKEPDVTETVAAIIKERGRVHGLVNNAGGQFPAPLSAISQRGFETVVRTNLVGGFLMAREVYNQSMEKHGGAIVNIVADMWRSMPGMGHSGAARAGMVNFTQTAAVEWAHSGVRVNAIAPGWIASSGLDTYSGAVRAMIPQLKKSVPIGRLGTEAEVASAICFLLCDAAAFISGATLRVDGAAPNASLIWPIQEPDEGKVQTYNGFHRAVAPKVLEPDE
ncbi:MAG: SDR family oxidoreductase [Myxococcales bacterium]|nr:SDR family oxidoreductase [Myxococcales bacterium]MCB9755195.1 SDR family oxidoreductase [Myxococcales bacterium]